MQHSRILLTQSNCCRTARNLIEKHVLCMALGFIYPAMECWQFEKMSGATTASTSSLVLFCALVVTDVMVSLL
ncbi:hypothetical protein D3C80_2187850 [compost metagenome]